MSGSTLTLDTTNTDNKIALGHTSQKIYDIPWSTNTPSFHETPETPTEWKSDRDIGARDGYTFRNGGVCENASRILLKLSDLIFLVPQT